MKTRKGLVLEGRYELTRLIATGGMGQVWEGKDKELDRPVAVKVLREEFAGEEGYLKRFRAEARHTAALAHEAIAGLYDYGELDGRAYIVMELVKGRPLSDIIEENPDGLGEERVIAILKELSKALDAAHVKGVVHRDVKPENVLVDDKNDWALKITDFGIARSNDQAKLTKTGLVMGTAQYLSPEQAMGKQATSLSDIYALGIVAYEMLTGSRPFTGTSQVEIAMAQVKEAPPELPERINADLRRLVMMMLAKAPANRPRSAAVVARILDSIERGEEPRFGTSAVRAPGARSDAGATSKKNDGTHSSRKITSKANSRTANPISPTGTRTAAMPLAGVGSKPVTIRSSSTAASAPSARSAASANSAASASSEHSEAARRGTSTGQSVGKVSLPLIIVIAVVVIAAIVAILVGTGVVSLGASADSLDWTGADVSALLRKATVTL
ncbi:serine/threonine protein kinase [Dermabacter vaginalis]|uniref:non-specific serine/threonine protein kinase n=1 Tax=Dermabacter vaginalis TaxID=1630135 RepID=A0A1B0ZKF0_9MICO|nr:serine/threonine-protein kinase [Dermabacter vaginalis]ANP28495.1 non-spific serine/threonine protein kinase [Dermabacter vaginalis]MCT2149902.1 serine/threonine protein kinase [Dermabacter vaginalis]